MATTQEQLLRLENARNKIRNKNVELGISQSADKLDKLADDIANIENRGAVSAQVQEGDTYTIPKGYHNGSGTVSGVAGGGNYNLQSKSVTPTKKQQNITPDSGYYGLSDVTVGAIPENFNDTSAVTAGAADVLANKVIVNAVGETVAGTMPNVGAVSKTLDASTGNQSYAPPKGFHNGNGKVQIVLEEKTVTPSKTAQTISPSSGKVLSQVSVGKIPDAYQDVSGVTAAAANVLDGKFIVTATGTKVEGTMANNGAVKEEIDGLSTMSYTIPAGFHDGTGTITLSDDIYEQLAAI